MFDLDKWQEIFFTIQQNKLRTFLTAFGVFWGIFMLVFMLGAGSGLENGVKQEFAGFASNALFVWSRKTKIPYNGLQAGRRFQYTLSNVEALKKKVTEIEVVAPRIEVGTVPMSYGTKYASYSMRGETPELTQINAKIMMAGRFLNQMDIDEKRKIAVLGQSVAKELFGTETVENNPNEIIGKYFKARNVFFQIVGVSKEVRVGNRAQEEEEAVFIPITTAQQIFNMSDRIDWFVCTLNPKADAIEIEKEVKLTLAGYHSVSPLDFSAIGSWNTSKEFQKFDTIFIAIRGFIWFVGIFTLLAGIIGVGNIMIITVKERTREIGVRKALGATPNSIISLILQEAIFLTALPGYIGLVTGTVVVFTVNTLLKTMQAENQFFANPVIQWQVAVGALTLLVISGIIAGLIPAILAAKVNPIEALRDE
ncbi:ABC-type antimicrobial peptide transport system, permease component [Bernardetia litoralis DSM 6794]|uniref:ABC-type antimicrobial peptide transport system, permease component n=1 Tax=Bernardetia litoralis (strain ATCC 23117 / DSM 6794 / NBRC 15988 / NCIMB 1366 / Fx l1 / Sio-4) TaxID=880071 RepID=I4AQA9_BERLS|nr:ABC transporter permease [Bernardetia litoralis]AFM06144.1 ABC-type antimicrobial peptide transport system, permease component [Bernardetia litoralis DSM 6794]